MWTDEEKLNYILWLFFAFCLKLMKYLPVYI